LSCVVRLVENSVGGRYQPLGGAGRIPGESDARSKTFLKRRDQSSGNPRITRVQQVLGRVRHHLRLPTRYPESLPIVNFGVGEWQFVTQPKVQRQPRGNTVGILRV